MKGKRYSDRIFELDFLRGLSIILMICHHIIYDVRNLFGLDWFAWEESVFFRHWLRPPFLFIFLFVSGICCTLSRNNYFRALKLSAVSAGFSTVFYLLSRFYEIDMYVYFNVLHMLAFGTLTVAIVDSLQKKIPLYFRAKGYLFAGILIVWLHYPLSYMNATRIDFLIPVHENFAQGVGMADYLPAIPWMGFFFIGVYFGRVYYTEKESLLPGLTQWLGRITRPVSFTGRNALWFYIFHQPVIIILLYILRIAGII